MANINIGGNVGKIINESTVHEGDIVEGDKITATDGGTVNVVSHDDGSAPEEAAPIGPIFVSHSHKDGEIVSAILELLGAGTEIQQGEILATSQAGMRIPGGARWADYLQARLKDTPLVVIVITENYLASSFCMVELGALWVQDKKLVPLLIPPVATGDLKHVLADIQVLRLEAEGLAEARRAVAEVLGETVTNEADWPAADAKLRQAIDAASGPAELEAGS